MVWLCWGLGDFTNGLGKDHGSCVATDPSGDQIVDDWSTEEYKLGQTTIKITDKFTSGTGKYHGISGGGTSDLDSGFHTPEGTFATRALMQGSYKLQPLTQ